MYNEIVVVVGLIVSNWSFYLLRESPIDPFLSRGDKWTAKAVLLLVLVLVPANPPSKSLQLLIAACLQLVVVRFVVELNLILIVTRNGTNQTRFRIVVVREVIFAVSLASVDC